MNGSKETNMKREWRCIRCGKLLGVVVGNRIHLRFTRGHEYIVTFPASGTCRGCGTLNECATPQTQERNLVAAK